jgi:hypothetical protein
MIAPPSASLVAPFLQFFFAEHLIAHRRVSTETVASYRDTFRLLLQFLQCSLGKEPSRLTLADMQAPSILQFLDSIEQKRGNCARTRNVRLAWIFAAKPEITFRFLESLARAGAPTRCVINLVNISTGTVKSLLI